MASTMMRSNPYLNEPDYDQIDKIEPSLMNDLNEYDDHESTIERAGLRQTSLAARLSSQMKKKHRTHAQQVLNSKASSVYNLAGAASESTNSIGTMYSQVNAPYANARYSSSSGSLRTPQQSQRQRSGYFPSPPQQNHSPPQYQQQQYQPQHPQGQYPQQYQPQYPQQHQYPLQFHPQYSPQQYQYQQQYPQQQYQQQYPQQQQASQSTPQRHFVQAASSPGVQQSYNSGYAANNRQSYGSNYQKTKFPSAQRVSLQSYTAVTEKSGERNSGVTKGSSDTDLSEDFNMSNSNVDSATVRFSTESSATHLDDLKAENEKLKEKVKKLEIPKEEEVDTKPNVDITNIEKSAKNSVQRDLEVQSKLNELKKKNQSYFYDIAKLKTDSARREQMNKQLIKFADDIMKKIPGYIDSQKSFKELISGMTIPASLKDSCSEALVSYDKRDAQVASASPSMKQSVMLSKEDIFGIFRNEVKTLNAKVSRLEEEKVRVEQVLQSRIDSERTTIRKFSGGKNEVLSPKSGAMRQSRRIASFKLIDVVQPELSTEHSEETTPKMK